jgi:hypothetical protein
VGLPPLVVEVPAPVIVFDSAVRLLDPLHLPGALNQDVVPRLEGLMTSQEGFPITVVESATPRLAVHSGITDQFVEGGRISSFSLPADAFVHTSSGAVVTLTARMQDGSPLPRWIRFDAQAGTFQVDPPAGYEGELRVLVIARDGDGREASALFRLFVGEDEKKQEKQQRPPGRAAFSDQLRSAVGKRTALQAAFSRVPADELLPARKMAAAAGSPPERVSQVSDSALRKGAAR